MALTNERIEKLKVMAARGGTENERETAKNILKQNGVDWQKKTSVPKMENPPPPPKKQTSSFDSDPFFNEALRIKGVMNSFDAMIVQLIVKKVLGRVIGKWDTMSNYWGLAGCDIQQVSKIRLIWAAKKEELQEIAMKAVYDSIPTR